MSNKTKEDEPVLIILDSDGYLIQAGQPDCLTKKEALNYATGGYTIKTITISQYRNTQWKWIYDKPKTQTP